MNYKFNFLISNPLYATKINNRTYVFTHGTHFKGVVTSPRWIKRLCDYIQIPYFSTKLNYWDKVQHTIFGNVSAKIHLHPKNLPTENLEKTFKYNFDRQAYSIGDLYRTIYYTRINDHDLAKRTKLKIADDEKIQSILDMLDDRDILHGFEGEYASYEAQFHTPKGEKVRLS